MYKPQNLEFTPTFSNSWYNGKTHIMDDDTSTYFYDSSSKNCFIQLDFGSAFYAKIDFI